MGYADIKLGANSIVNGLLAGSCALILIARLSIHAARSQVGCIVRDGLDHFGLFAAICLIGALASYPIAVETHGFDDAGLERLDRMLRFDWTAWYAVVAAHPTLQIGERIAYQSIFVTPAILLGYFTVTRRRAEARLLIASFWFAALITLALFPLTPAQGPLATLWRHPIPYMPESGLYQANLIPLLRHHQIRDVSLDSLHGLVCAPSFHTVSAVLYIVAAWPIRSLRWPLLVLNLAMLLATPVEGTHYLTDMIIGAIVAGVASVAVRRGLLGVVRARGAQANGDPFGRIYGDVAEARP